MAFVFGYVVSMRYLLVGYLRRSLCAAARVAFQESAQLVLLNIAGQREIGS
jgi:hypothetical protein